MTIEEEIIQGLIAKGILCENEDGIFLTGDVTAVDCKVKCTDGNTYQILDIKDVIFLEKYDTQY